MSQFKQQIEAHRPALLRHCYRMLGSFSDAEDLVQDVLFKAWQAQDSYGGLAPLEHWLMRIATNRCLNELEGKRRRGLPHYDFAAAPAGAMMVPVEEGAVGRWLTAAPDDALFETLVALWKREKASRSPSSRCYSACRRGNGPCCF